jgi:hypothetical protein
MRIPGLSFLAAPQPDREVHIEMPELKIQMKQIIQISKEPRPQGGALNQNSKAKTEIPKQVRDDKKRDPNHLVMLNLFQHLECFFLPSADASFIPVHRMGFSDALLIKGIEMRKQAK